MSTVPFVRGFRPPTRAQCLAAIGSAERAYTADSDFFRPVPAPTCEDDWYVCAAAMPGNVRGCGDR